MLERLNPFAISGLLITATYLPLFIFIFTRGRTLLSKIFSLNILFIFLWGVGSFFIGITSNPKLALLIWKPTYVAVLFIPVFFYHATSIIQNEKISLGVILAYLQASIFTILLINNFMVAKMQYVFDSFYYHEATPAYALSFVIWSIIAILAHLKLIYNYNKYYPEQKQQIRALIFASIGFFGGITAFFPPFHINFYPYGNFLIPIHSLIVTYAILKHQFLDIKIIFQKGLAYSILLILTSSIYLIIVLILEKFSQKSFGYTSLSVSITVAFLLGLVFAPLRNKIQEIVDRTVFKKSPSEIFKENELLRQQIAQTEKLKILGTLAGGMAHEIRNPLTAITTFAEHLPQKLDNKEFLEKFARIVGAEARRIDELVTQLLDFARPAQPVLKNTDINKLVLDILSLLSSNFLKHNIQATYLPYGSNGCYIHVDPNQIKQALLNIFLNAIDAMPNGGDLRVSVNQKNSYDSQDRNILLITITDTGSGIAPDDLPYIFDPFFTRKDSGTGLGLAITHGILNEHGGEIKVSSALGRGTTFELTLLR